MVVAGNSALLGSLALSLDLATPHRVAALGLEVHDITAPLNRQGSIGIAAIPGSMQTDLGRFLTVKLTDGDNQQMWIPHMVLTPSLPSSRALASTIPSYVEWEAAKGAYVTGRMIQPPKPRHFTVVQGNSIQAASQFCLGATEEGVLSSGESSWTYHHLGVDNTSMITASTTCSPSFDSGFQPFQVWLSGLAATSTFKVVLRTIVEFFPEVTDGAVIANAVSTTPYDPNALIEYHRRRSVLPVAVPVDMNAKGDWWKMVQNAGRIGLQVATGVVPSLLNAAGQPALSGAAMIGLNRLNAQLRQAPPSNRAQKKKQPKNKNKKS